MSRWILIRELLLAIIQYPLSIFVGFGPDSIFLYFEHARSILISSYFPAMSAIDSGHDILVDILFQYGIIPLICIGILLWKKWKHIHIIGRESMILGFLFLLFNPFVVVHMLTISLAATLYE